MNFDNLQSVSSVSDTLPYEAISITGRDCFWDGSVPNPLKVSVGSPTMSVSSNIPEPSGEGRESAVLRTQRLVYLPYLQLPILFLDQCTLLGLFLRHLVRLWV